MLAWRDCPARFEFGMRRHAGRESPEAHSPQSAYGSAIHDVLAAIEEDVPEEEAIRAAFQRFVNWLEPPDIDRLRIDVRTYRERLMTGVRPVVIERDLRIPLFVHNGVQIYFRFRLDKLYQLLDDEGRFVHIDYKSSKWAKSGEEVDEDLQLWAYNVGIFEVFAECEDLLQIYDQLSYGMETTRKTAEQRESMRGWMIEVATAMLEDSELAPRWNRWCRWCALKMDCTVVREDLSNWAESAINPLIIREAQVKADGSPSKKMKRPRVNEARIIEYAELLGTVKEARKVLGAFEGAVEAVLRDTPDGELAQIHTPAAPHGLAKRTRSGKHWTPEGLRQAQERVGDEFFYFASVTEAAVERHYGKGEGAKDRIAAVLELREVGQGATVLEPLPAPPLDA
jgi:hypothetical protein